MTYIETIDSSRRKKLEDLLALPKWDLEKHTKQAALLAAPTFVSWKERIIFDECRFIAWRTIFGNYDPFKNFEEAYCGNNTGPLVRIIHSLSNKRPDFNFNDWFVNNLTNQGLIEKVRKLPKNQVELYKTLVEAFLPDLLVYGTNTMTEESKYVSLSGLLENSVHWKRAGLTGMMDKTPLHHVFLYHLSLKRVDQFKSIKQMLITLAESDSLRKSLELYPENRDEFAQCFLEESSDDQKTEEIDQKIEEPIKLTRTKISEVPGILDIVINAPYKSTIKYDNDDGHDLKIVPRTPRDILIYSDDEKRRLSQRNIVIPKRTNGPIYTGPAVNKELPRNIPSRTNLLELRSKKKFRSTLNYFLENIEDENEKEQLRDLVDIARDLMISSKQERNKQKYIPKLKVSNQKRIDELKAIDDFIKERSEKSKELMSDYGGAKNPKKVARHIYEKVKDQIMFSTFSAIINHYKPTTSCYETERLFYAARTAALIESTGLARVSWEGLKNLHEEADKTEIIRTTSKNVKKKKEVCEFPTEPEQTEIKDYDVYTALTSLEKMHIDSLFAVAIRLTRDHKDPRESRLYQILTQEHTTETPTKQYARAV